MARQRHIDIPKWIIGGSCPSGREPSSLSAPAINSIIEANSPSGAGDEARDPGVLLTARIKRRKLLTAKIGLASDTSIQIFPALAPVTPNDWGFFLSNFLSNRGGETTDDGENQF